jgi:hypothetical protein
MGRKPLADPLCLPLKRWPEPDRSAWIAAQKPAGLFDDIGPAGEWRPATWFKTEKGYGRFLGWLARYHPNELAREPAERLRKEIFSAYLDHLGESTAGYSALSYVEDLIRAFRIISGNAPPNWLNKLQKGLRARARPVRDKRQHIIAADELVRCGMELMRRAETARDWSARRRAVAYRDGLAVALLAYRPIRMKNFSRLRIGTELVREGVLWRLLLSGNDTKTHQPFEAAFPANLIPKLECYLTDYRPVLLRGERGCTHGTTDALWISEVGTAWEQGAMSRRIGNATKAFFNRRVPAHLFRDAAATTIAVDKPTCIADAHHVLGHATPLTTERHYIQARSIVASRRHLDVLKRLQTALEESQAEH